jgi:hypothetical protein
LVRPETDGIARDPPPSLNPSSAKGTPAVVEHDRTSALGATDVLVHRLFIYHFRRSGGSGFSRIQVVGIIGLVLHLSDAVAGDHRFLIAEKKSGRISSLIAFALIIIRFF